MGEESDLNCENFSGAGVNHVFALLAFYCFAVFLVVGIGNGLDFNFFHEGFITTLRADGVKLDFFCALHRYLLPLGVYFSELVRVEGFEPSRGISPAGPEPAASSTSATPAF